jgi:hypothetical protein
VHAQLSGQLIASFPAGDALEAVDLGLELLDEAEGYDLALAVALSETWNDGPVLVGNAFDDAFFLAGRANAGELLVDGSVRDRLPGHFLFSRQVATGGLRAAAIDRRHPRRSDCVRALVGLGAPPLPAPTRALLEPLRAALREPGALVGLEGPIGAGAAELIDAARREHGVERALVVGPATGRAVPLESLRRALAAASHDHPARGLGESLAAGEILPLAGAVALVEAHLGVAAPSGPVAWVVLNPLAAVDLATLEVVGALRAARPGRVRVLARAPLDVPVPSALGAVSRTLTLPALRTSDACEVVGAILGPGVGEDLVRRVAILGGDSTLGCEEAVRLLVASGDLVRAEAGFEWRTAPRPGSSAEAPEELARARLELVSPEARHVLELLSVLPVGASRELARAVATLDGVTPRELERGLAALGAEGWLSLRDAPSEQFVRLFVQRSMPPARLAELHRLVLSALPTSVTHRHAQAHFALEGGLEEQARALGPPLAAILRAAGFAHAADTLPGASAAPRPSVRVPRPSSAPLPAAPDETLVGVESPDPRAPAVTASERGLRPRPREDAAAPPPASLPPVAPSEGLDEAAGPDPAALRAAVRARDVPALERWIEQATAAGSDLAAVARLRAVIDLMRGDVVNAEARLARTVGDDASARPLLAQAMVTLGGGRTADAVRLALRALAVSLRAGDTRGRSASLVTLAACYRAEGRGADADVLSARAQG